MNFKTTTAVFLALCLAPGAFKSSAAIPVEHVAAYHLDDAGGDYDGDGLPNYAEYLVSEVLQIQCVDPERARSNFFTPDAYLPFGTNMYLGSVFTDHDRVDDAWEAKYEKGDFGGTDYAMRGVYDPDADRDCDGWGNYDEFRAGTDPTRTWSLGSRGDVVPEFPVPCVEIDLTGFRGASDGSIKVCAWNEPSATNIDRTCGPADAKWHVALGGAPTASTRFVGRLPSGVRRYCLAPGHVVPGSFRLTVRDTASATDASAAQAIALLFDRDGKIVVGSSSAAAGVVVGTLDYAKGCADIDFGDRAFGGFADGVDLASCEATLEWKYRIAGSPGMQTLFLADADTGFLRKGSTTVVVEYTGENRSAMGVVRHVDVGWAGAKFTVELTDYNPITPRFEVPNGPADRVDSDPFNGGVQSNRLEAAEGISETYPTRVRVVRYAINGYPVVKHWGNGLADVVYDKTWRHPNRQFCELDFLVDDKFDIDWTDSFTAKVATLDGITRGSSGAPGTAGNIAQVIGPGTSITNIEYLVVFGDGPAFWERGTDTNTVVTARVDRIVRRFDHNRVKPVAVSVDGVQYSARPTFKWRMDGEEPFVSRYGSSYTAFRLQVSKSGNIVYDSGILRAPAIDAGGNFTWTAPICAGSMIENGQFFDTVGSYSWQVSMYNAKFRYDDSEFWSDSSIFSTAANAQQEVNDHGYSSIALAVRYAGSSLVLEKCADMTTTKGKVIVQAFSTPDFSGDPLSAGVATSDVAELARPDIKNAWLKGLPAIGTYYVRAFIDMDGDGKLSEWEPWGYVADAVTLVNDGAIVDGEAQVKAPFVSVWIDDSDSDGDWIPDAYEYAAKGWTTPWETLKGNNKKQPTGVVAVMPDGEIVLPFAINEKITTAAISLGLPGVSLTAMQSEDFVSALLGLDLSNKETIASINAVATTNAIPGSVHVAATGFSQSSGNVYVSVVENGVEIPLDAQGRGSMSVILSRRETLNGAWESMTNMLPLAYTDGTLTTAFPTNFTARPAVFDITISE